MSAFEMDPIPFAGGSKAEYRIVQAQSGTIMTEHIPSGQKRLSARPSASPSKAAATNVPAGGVGVLNTILSGVSAIASVYGAYEARAGRKEVQQARQDLGDLHSDLNQGFADIRLALRRSEDLLGALSEIVRLEAELTRDEVRESRRHDLQLAWRNLEHDWDAFLNAETARVQLAMALRDAARDFINRLNGEVDPTSEREAADTAPYLFMAHVALSMAYDGIGESGQAQRQLMELATDMLIHGRDVVAGATLLGVEEHREAIELIWGLRRAAIQMAGAADLSSALDLAGAEPLQLLPILFQSSDILLEDGSSGLRLDDVLPLETVAQIDVATRLGASLESGSAASPTARQAMAALGHPRPAELQGEIDLDVLAAVVQDADAGLGDLRRDFEVTSPITMHFEGQGQTVPLYWEEIADDENMKAWKEQHSGLYAAAEERITRLLFFLDGILGRDNSSEYPSISFQPRASLAQMCLERLAEGDIVGESAARARAEADTLMEQARAEGDIHYELDAQLLLLRLDAWTEAPGVADQLEHLLASNQFASNVYFLVISALVDLARAGHATTAAAFAARFLPDRPDSALFEQAWLGARLDQARILGFGGQQKKARGLVTRVRRQLEGRSDREWIEPLLQDATALYEQLGTAEHGEYAPGRRGSRTHRAD